MFLFSYFKKKNESKSAPDVSNYSLATDVLETELSQKNTRPRCSVISEALLLSRSRQKPTNITLVQGSSESKPKNHKTSQNQQPEPTSSIRREYLANITPQPEIRSVYHVQHRAPSHIETLSIGTRSTLYPNLDPIRRREHSSSVKTRLMKIKKLKSIHDIAGEICFLIQERILNADTIKKKFDKLQSDAQKDVQAMQNKIANPTKLEYTFNKELEVRENCSHINNYEKLRTFDDVKNCHRRAAEPIERKISKDKIATPIFQSYHSRFRCYKGQKSDIVVCD